MNLPDEISVGLTINGLEFRLRVAALPRGCGNLFPDFQAADEVFSAPCLPAAVVQAAACALDAAVAKFQVGFQASLSDVLTQRLDGLKVGAGDTAHEPERAAA